MYMDMDMYTHMSVTAPVSRAPPRALCASSHPPPRRHFRGQRSHATWPMEVDAGEEMVVERPVSADPDAEGRRRLSYDIYLQEVRRRLFLETPSAALFEPDFDSRVCAAHRARVRRSVL